MYNGIEKAWRQECFFHLFLPQNLLRACLLVSGHLKDFFMTNTPPESEGSLDDPSLLSLMLKDLQEAPDIFFPTNYWKVMERKLLPELRNFGLKDFRRRARSPLESFGAVLRRPVPPQINLASFRLLNNRFTYTIPGYDAALERLSVRLASLLRVQCSTPVNTRQAEILGFERTEMLGDRFGAKSLRTISASNIGNPEWWFEVGGKNYNVSFLNKYLNYAWCCQFVDFDKISVIVEIGSGSGNQAEVLKKLFPDMTILLFDIPPQLYVCERYLSKVFPGDIVSYRETREMTSLDSLETGKIYIFGNSKFPLLTAQSNSLFWNETSFQEMEPDVVANYLSTVNKTMDHVFMNNSIAGKEVAKRPGAPGVLTPTTLEHYKEGLKDFDLISSGRRLTSLAVETEPGGERQANMFWSRSA